MTYDSQFDIIELPSEGLFYPNKCSKVKVYHLTLVDEEIMTSPNLWASGDMIDKLLERKVLPVDGETPFIHPQKMLIGDRLALLIFLRTTMDNIYTIEVKDERGEKFSYNFDLTTLKTKDVTAKPNSDFQFDFLLPKSGKRVVFRLMNGEDEKEIRVMQRKMAQENAMKVMTLEKLIVEVDGERDKILISNFIKKMQIKDANALIKYMDEVTPSIDLNIEIEHPKKHGVIIKQPLEFDVSFFLPST